VASEEDFFETHKAIDPVLTKRLHAEIENDNDGSEEDFKQIRKRVEQDRVEVYQKSTYLDTEVKSSGFKKRPKK